MGAYGVYGDVRTADHNSTILTASSTNIRSATLTIETKLVRKGGDEVGESYLLCLDPP